MPATVPQKFYCRCVLPEIMLQLILLLLALSLSVLAAEGAIPGTGGLRGHDLPHVHNEVDRSLTPVFDHASHRKFTGAIQVRFLNFHHGPYSFVFKISLY